MPGTRPGMTENDGAVPRAGAIISAAARRRFRAAVLGEMERAACVARFQFDEEGRSAGRWNGLSIQARSISDDHSSGTTLVCARGVIRAAKLKDGARKRTTRKG